MAIKKKYKLFIFEFYHSLTDIIIYPLSYYIVCAYE